MESVMLDHFPDDFNYLETETYLHQQGYKEVGEHPDFLIKWPDGLLEKTTGKDFHLNPFPIMHGLGLRTEHMELFKAIMKDLGYDCKETKIVFYKKGTR